MFRAAIAVLLALSAARSGAAGPARHVDPEAMKEARRGEAEPIASPRAIAHYLEARRHARAGDAPRALQHLRLAVTYDELSPELRVSLARALAEAGEILKAEGEARRALELHASGRTASEAHVLVGQVALARRQVEAAARAFRGAIRAESALAARGDVPDAEPWRLLAALQLDVGDEEGAVRTLEDLATRAPRDASGFRELGRKALDRRDLGAAERYLRRAALLDPRDVETLRLLAQVHDALRRDPEARDDLLAILRVDPEDGTALVALGRLSVQQGDLAAGREWFRRYLRATPGTDAHVRVAFQWLEAGQGQEALSAARAGIADVGADPRLRFAEGLALQELRRWADSARALAAIPPDAGEVFPSARVALADALSRDGRHAEAGRVLDGSLAARPKDVRLLAMRATVLDRAGRSDEAVALLRRALDERGPASGRDLSDLYAALAESLVRAGRPAEAVATLRDAVAARPRDEELLYALGAAYERAGEGEVALAQMRALLSVNPDHAEALNFVGYAYAERGIRLDEAEQLVRRALEIRPRSGHVLDSLGWVLFRRGDHRRAVEVLEQAEALAGPDATILEHLGDAYRAAARLGDAARAYRGALASVGEELPSEQARRRTALERKLQEVTERAGRP